MIHLASNLNGGYSIVGLEKPNRVARIGRMEKRILRVGLKERMKGRNAKEAERRERFMR